MEETIDPILSKLNGKTQAQSVTAEPDPILQKLNASKKKGNTVSAPASNDGTTQAGLKDSPQPVEEPGKPSVESTEEVSREQKYFDAYSEKLQKKLADTYSKKFETEKQDFIKKLGGLKEPDLANKQQVEEYNNKVNQLNAFQQKRGKEIDDEFKSQYETEAKTEFDRVNKQSENFEKALGEFQQKRAAFQQKENNKESGFSFLMGANPRVPDFQKALVNTFISVITDMIPSAWAARNVTTTPFEETLSKRDDVLTGSRNAMGVQKTIFDDIDYKYNKIKENRNLKPEEKAQRLKEREEAYRLHVGDEKYKKEKTLYQLNQVQDALSAWREMSIQEKERELKLKGIPKTWDDAEGVAGVINYGLSTVSETAGQIPASIATLGSSSYFMERSDILKEGIEAKAERTGTTPEKIIASGDFKEIEDIATKYGAFNAALDMLSLGTGISVVAKKTLGKALLKRPALQLMVQGVNTVPGKTGIATVTESFTEGWQEINTIAASKIASGESSDYSEAIEQFDDQDWNRVEESVRKGAIGGGVLAGGGATMAARNRADKLSAIKELRAKQIEKTVPKSPVETIQETRPTIQSTADTQNIDKAVDEIIKASVDEVTPAPSEPIAPVVSDPVVQEVQVTETPVQEDTSPVGSGTEEEAIQEETAIKEQQPVQEEDLTIGDNYVKKQNNWFLKNKDGNLEPVIDMTRVVPKGQEDAEIVELKKLKTELEKPTIINEEVTVQQERNRIKELPRNTIMARARGYFLDGGKIRWDRTKEVGKKGAAGVKAETGMADSEMGSLKWINDKNGLSPEQIGESLANLYGEDDVQDYRNAVIELITSENRKDWFKNQRDEADTDLGIQEQNRIFEANQVESRLKELELQKEAEGQIAKDLYENERRVYRNAEEEGQGAPGEVQGSGRTGPDAATRIRENGNPVESQKAALDLQGLDLTHVPGLGMGQNQAKGTYVSTEKAGNRYETETNKPVKATVKIKNPFVAKENAFYEIQRAAIQDRFSKNSVEELTEAEADLLAAMMTDYFVNAGYDSIYFPETEYQEGELIVFDKANVEFETEASKKLVNLENERQQKITEASKPEITLDFLGNEEEAMDMILARATGEKDRGESLVREHERIRAKFKALQALIDC